MHAADCSWSKCWITISGMKLLRSFLIMCFHFYSCFVVKRHIFVSGHQICQGYEFCSVQRTAWSNAYTPNCKSILWLKWTHWVIVKYGFGLLMVLFLFTNRYLRYVHLQQQRDMLVLLNSHFVVRAHHQGLLILDTHIHSGETDLIDWLKMIQ